MKERAEGINTWKEWLKKHGITKQDLSNYRQEQGIDEEKNKKREKEYQKARYGQK